MSKPIKFVRLRDVNMPARGHKFDAGIDFFVPKFDKSFIDDLILKNPHLNTPVKNSSCITLSSSLNISQYGGNTLEFDLSDENTSFVKYDESKGLNYFPIMPFSRVNIPSGIYCQMAESSRALIAANKSGIASKHGLIFGAQVVDFEYQGEIHINVINTSSKVVRIYEDMKLIQFIETPIIISDIEEVDTLSSLYCKETSRADGGFGSTDKKPTQLNS
jgi:dUTPase